MFGLHASEDHFYLYVHCTTLNDNDRHFYYLLMYTEELFESQWLWSLRSRTNVQRCAPIKLLFCIAQKNDPANHRPIFTIMPLAVLAPKAVCTIYTQWRQPDLSTIPSK